MKIECDEETQKRSYDTGWSDEKMCPGCSKAEGTAKHMSVMEESQTSKGGGR